MPGVTLKNIKGAEVGNVELSDAVFAMPPNTVVVREVYNAFRANQRQGTHKTKTRGFVSGGGKKPWKQKGTGRARQGSIRAPQWRHGAIVFGPQPRDYREKVNVKKRHQAFASVLSSRNEEGRMLVVDSIDFGAAAKTKNVVDFLKAVGVEDYRSAKTLIVTKDKNESLLRGARNMPSVEVEVVGSLNIFQLLVNDYLIITREAVEALQETLS